MFRGNPALTTLSMWPNVRRGEKTWIFPFQQEADIAFNSALDYELAVLKPLVEPLLAEVKAAPPSTPRRAACRLPRQLPRRLGLPGPADVHPARVHRPQRVPVLTQRDRLSRCGHRGRPSRPFGEGLGESLRDLRSLCTTNPPRGFRFSEAAQRSSSLRSAWAEKPPIRALRARTGTSLPSTRTRFAPSRISRPRVPAAW